MEIKIIKETWRDKNIERHNELCKRWKQDNRTQYNETAKKWRDNNKEKHIKYCASWVEKNKEKSNEYHKIQQRKYDSWKRIQREFLRSFNE